MRNVQAQLELLPPDEREDVEAFLADEPVDVEQFLAMHDAERAANAPYRAAVRRFAERYVPHRGWRAVLDLDPGDGANAAFLGLRGYDLTVVDAGGPLTGFAKHRLVRRGVTVTFAQRAEAIGAAGGYHAVLDGQPATGGGRTQRDLARALRWRGILISRTASLEGVSMRGAGLVRLPELDEPGVRCYRRSVRISDLLPRRRGAPR